MISVEIYGVLLPKIITNLISQCDPPIFLGIREFKILITY